jgi:hypothetical protein
MSFLFGNFSKLKEGATSIQSFAKNIMIYENDNDDEDDDDLEENEDLTLNREENKHQKTINMMQKTKKSNQNNVDLDFFSQFTSNISSGK